MPSRHRNRLPHRRGSDPSLHLGRHPSPLEAGREGVAGARRRARRPHRDARLERLPAHGALLRRFGNGRGAAHDQPAPVPGADRIHRQPCRGPVPLLRFHVRAAAGAARAEDALRQGLRRDDRPVAHAVAERSRTCSATRTSSARRTAITTGRRSTSAPRLRFATRRERRDIPRACSIRTGRRCCIPTAPCASTVSPSRRPTRC